MDKYMKKSDVIAYIRKEAKEAQSAFDESVCPHCGARMDGAENE